MDGKEVRTAMVGKFASAFTAAGRSPVMLDPHLEDAIGKIDVPAAGIARASIHMPTLLAPMGPTDQSILTNPDDATKRYRLGGFTIALTGVAAQRMKWVELRPDAAGYTLEIHITPQADIPAGVVAVPPNVPVTTRYFLHATVNAMVREWELPTVAIAGADWKLSLHIDGNAPDVVAQRDALYRAMTSSPDAKLIVRRALSLAVPTSLPRRFVFVAKPPPAVMAAAAHGGLVGAVGLLPMNPHPIGPMPLPHPIPHPLPHPIPHPPPVVQPIPPHPIPTPPVIHPPIVHPPVIEPQLVVSTVTIDTSIPFQFDKTLDQNVFAKLTPDVGTTATGWNHLTSLWQPDPATAGVVHHYFQDKSDPRVVYFLPDQFVIQRRPGSPHKPWLSLSTLSDATKAAINYVAVPDWNVDRVAAAAADLVTQGVVANHYPLQLLRVADAVLSLKVPRADPQGGPGFIDQTGASIDTATAIHGSVTVVIDDSSSVIDAIISDDSDLFSGPVTIKLGDVVAKIPFVARAAQFIGDGCDFTMTTDEATSTVTVTALNAIESPITIDALPISFMRAGAPVPVDVTIPPDFPATIAPGETFVQAFSCSPAAFEGLSFQVDTSSLTVHPDRAALIDLIVDPDLPGTATRDVKLNVLAAAFAPPATGPALVAVQVAFAGSASTVSFVAPTADPKPTFVSGVAHLRIPLRDFLLGTTSQYAYQVHRIYADGTQQVGDPISDSLDEVFVQVPAAGF